MVIQWTLFSRSVIRVTGVDICPGNDIAATDAATSVRRPECIQTVGHLNVFCPHLQQRTSDGSGLRPCEDVRIVNLLLALIHNHDIGA